ncbi:MAG: PAS domain S-box protein, partial [Dethiobacteria bacterium]|nr:PAS domain S-box protein [Dethiobacteria bacterium]
MSDSDRYEATVRDITILYELALSTGRTLDLKDNCRQFIKQLMGCKNIAFCSVLIKDDHLDEHGDANRATVIAAYPERFSLVGYINDLPQYVRPLKENSFAEIGPADPVYHSLTANFGLSGGIYVLFALGQIGLMQFYFNRGDAVLKQQELHQLSGVMEKFAISLQGCLAFRRLIVEIAQRENIEQKLRVSEEKHRRLFETMVQGVIYQNINGQIISANPAAERIIGLTLGEILGRSVFDPALKAIREDGSPLPVDEHPARVALTSDKAVGPEILGILQPSSGKQIWLLVTAIPLFEPGSAEPFQIYITLTDITERRRIEQDYQVLLREMINGFALHEIILDNQKTPVDYRFLAVNPAFERITGLSANEVVGKTVLEVLPTTENEWVITYGRVAITGEPIYVENYFTALDKYFEVTAFSPAPGQFAT